MKQVVQSANGGPVELVEVPMPVPEPTEVLVQTINTVISPGTERFVTNLARSSLLAKAKARPDLVRQVVDKARKDGLRTTFTAVRTRLNEDLPLGYSGAGRIVELGSMVRDLSVGQLVATAGGGHATHAHFQTVPQTLVAPIPEGVPCDQAAFATIASIALHGFRLAEVGMGSKVVVVGLGLIGQLTCRLAQSAGCDVVGIDLSPAAVEQATASGALGLLEKGDATTKAILEWSRGRGADAVLITAGAKGDSRILQSVPPRCRDRATVVAVGDVGLDVDRNAFYHHELELKVARSYGPGRYDPSYEAWGVDYPIGYVRWTEGRNLEAVLDLMAAGRLDVSDLISHRHPIEEAAEAYGLLEQSEERVVGIVFDYPEQADTRRTLTINRPPLRPRRQGTTRIGICGAGNFVKGTILPAIKSSGLGDVVHVSSSSGVTAARLAERHGIERASAGADEVINDPNVDLVVIATPHSSHAPLVVQALEAGKHVYVEKPLAITEQQLDDVIDALERCDGLLHVGFNRRWSPMVQETKKALAGSGPLVIDYRVNAGPIPEGHWYRDPREGGRLLGEVCHFIDTCSAIVEADPTDAFCIGPNSDRSDSYALLLGYADGSTATISYAADGHHSTAKERVEVLGRGHTVLIDDYRSLTIDGAEVKTKPGKGHVESLRSVGRGIHGAQLASATATTRTALAART